VFSSEKTVEQLGCWNNVHCTFTIHKLALEFSHQKKEQNKKTRE
jgi:hypothetical protein